MEWKAYMLLVFLAPKCHSPEELCAEKTVMWVAFPPGREKFKILSLEPLLIFFHVGQLGVIERQEGRTGCGCGRVVIVVIVVARNVDVADPKIDVQDLLESHHGTCLVCLGVGVDEVQLGKIGAFGNHGSFGPKDHVHIVVVVVVVVAAVAASRVVNDVVSWTRIADSMGRRIYLCGFLILIVPSRNVIIIVSMGRIHNPYWFDPEGWMWTVSRHRTNDRPEISTNEDDTQE